MIIDSKASFKSAKLGLKINWLIQKGDKYYERSIQQIKAYYDVINRHQQNMRKLPQKDIYRLRYNIRVLEIMKEKGEKENQATPRELELITNTLKSYQKELIESYEIEKQKARFLQVIDVFSRRIMILRNSKYLKAIERAIHKHQKAQHEITVVKLF
jgi:hypothetical protein